jgi:hypothetical protein
MNFVKNISFLEIPQIDIYFHVLNVFGDLNHQIIANIRNLLYQNVPFLEIYYQHPPIVFKTNCSLKATRINPKDKTD